MASNSQSSSLSLPNSGIIGVGHCAQLTHGTNHTALLCLPAYLLSLFLFSFTPSLFSFFIKLKGQPVLQMSKALLPSDVQTSVQIGGHHKVCVEFFLPKVKTSHYWPDLCLLMQDLANYYNSKTVTNGSLLLTWLSTHIELTLLS